MPSATSTREAIKNWEAQNPDTEIEEASEVNLYCQFPPMAKMGEELNMFVSVEKLSLATNSIERMTTLQKCRNLRILSLGRNKIKRITMLEDIGNTLEELWISYNQIEKLDGLEKCVKLNTLFIGNNKIQNWDETNKLAVMPQIKSVLMTGNPIATQVGNKDEFISHLVKRVPQLDTVDGKQVTSDHRQNAENL